MKHYSDSTMKSWTKQKLIDFIRCLETNCENLEYLNHNQFKVLCRLTRNLSSNEFDAIMLDIEDSNEMDGE